MDGPTKTKPGVQRRTGRKLSTGLSSVPIVQLLELG